MSSKPHEDRGDADKSIPASGTPDKDELRSPEELLQESLDEKLLRLQELMDIAEETSSSTGEGLVTPRGDDTGTWLGEEITSPTRDVRKGTPANDTESAIAPGTVLSNKYRVIKKLGEGGMASVWLVQHLVLDENRALKVIRSFIAEKATFQARFGREARILARLKHPNAVIVYDTGVVGGLPYIEMEYLDGRTLRDRLASGQPCRLRWVEWVLREVCDVLARAHELGIVHLDLKPANIFVTTDQVSGHEMIKVLDFGIAMIISAEPASWTAPAVRMQSAFGTPAYSSPEQWAMIPDVAIDYRSDLYSLGVILYEMLTGARPFKGTATQLVKEHAQKKPPRFAETAPTVVVPKAVEDLVLQCLEKDPNARPKSASELAERFSIAIEAQHNRTAATLRFPARVVVGVPYSLSIQFGRIEEEAPEETGERAIPADLKAPDEVTGEPEIAGESGPNEEQTEERTPPRRDDWMTSFFVSFMASVPGQDVLPAMVRVRISLAVENLLIGGTAETLPSKNQSLSEPAASGSVGLLNRFVKWLGRNLKSVAAGSVVATTRHVPDTFFKQTMSSTEIQEVRQNIGRRTDNAEVVVPLKGRAPEIQFTLRGRRSAQAG